jgi:hypothetical protein
MPALSIGLVQIEGPSASTRPGPGWIDRACHLGPDSRLLKQPPTDRTSRSCQSGCGVARTDSQSGASDQCHSQCFWPDRTNRPERAQSTGSERTTRTAAFAKTPTASEPIGPFLHAALGRAGPDRTDPGRQDRTDHRIDKMRPDLDSPSTSTSSRPARTPEPTRSQRQGYRFRSIGVSIPARRRSVPAREFRCRTTRQRPNRQATSPRVLRRKDLCPQRSACGAPENFHLSKARRRPCSALEGGATSSRPGQIEPFHEVRPPPSTPPIRRDIDSFEPNAEHRKSAFVPSARPFSARPCGLNCKFGATTAHHPAPSRSKPTQPGRTVPTERARTAGRWFGEQSSTARRPHPR